MADSSTSSSSTSAKSFGTAPVFFTAISTILGAILFLRFGFAVGTLGFWGVIVIILLGHLVTIPTALAISELATNKRVEGGGEYFIISRSFGLNIGATIGFALYLSQAISVAFYVIAFTEAFEFFFNWVGESFDMHLPRQVISLPAMLVLSVVILKKGANLGVKMLYVVVFILFVSLVLFFLGKTDYSMQKSFSLFDLESRNMDDFFIVFAIVFPAFTGMTAGVGLSGDLKNPSKSIPLGTTVATVSGMIIYFFIVYKLASSASMEDLTENQLIMAKIALGGSFVIPLGLAASTISSAIGSVMVAPRTLQALAGDRSFPSRKMNAFLAKGRGASHEPYNATLVTVAIAFIFVALGNVNTVAGIISMFFMVTYGALCLISFLYHFGASPSYRPGFRSRWYISLVGFITAVWVMFRINSLYAIGAIILIVILYIYISNYHKGRKGLVSIFTNALMQLNREIQVYLQQSRKSGGQQQEWRPSAVCISKDSFDRQESFQFLNWISYRFGFGTYIHLIEDYYSKSVHKESQVLLKKLIEQYKGMGSHVFIDTLISPSYTSAIAQTIQLPGISGMENNMLILEYSKKEPVNLTSIIDNYSLINAGNFDVCIFGSSTRPLNYKLGIDVWLRALDNDNSHLMILLSFIIQGHPDWKKSNIRIFEICKPGQKQEARKGMEDLVKTGRLPITTKNIDIIEGSEERDFREEVLLRSEQAALTIIGFTGELLKFKGKAIFEGYEKIGHVLFVNASERKIIE